MFRLFSIKKVLLIFLAGFILPCVGFAAEKSPKYFHIVLTPEDAMSYDIENYTTSLIDRDVAKKNSRFETIAWTVGMVIGVTIVSGVIFYYVVPPLASILYSEGVEQGVLRGNYVPPPPVPEKGIIARVVETVTTPFQWIRTAGNTGLGWAGFWANYWNDFTQGRMIDANVNLAGAIGRNTVEFFRVTGTYLVRGVTPAPILERYDLRRINSFDQLSDEINVDGMSRRNKKTLLYSVAGLIGNGIAFPFYYRKISQIRQKYFAKKSVNTHYLDSAYQKIVQNSDLACQSVGARYSLKITEKDVKTVRFNFSAKEYKNVFYQGELQEHEDLIALDLAEDGLFYYLKDFLCETAAPYSPFSYPRSINDLIQRNESINE